MCDEHGAPTTYLRGPSASKKHAGHTFPNVVAKTIQAIESFRGHLPHSFQARCHCDGVGVERSAVMDLQAASVIEDRHHSTRSAHGAHRKSAADNFAEACEIGLNPESVGGSMIRNPEVEDLIGNQQYPMASGFLAQELEKAFARLDHANAERHGIN